MNKYLAVFKISFQQEFVYRVNFIMWRVRNITQIFLIFFLWDTVFSDPKRVVLGYDRVKILTYVFGIIIVKAIVFSTRSIDIAGDIARGDLSNYLIKPINYFKYWFIRDLSSKTLNLFFAFFETLALFLILRPPFYFQTNIPLLVVFVISLVFAVLLYFLLVLLFNMFPFWYPENAWGIFFLFMIFSDFLGGVVFPIDILPNIVQKLLYLSPFPYILFIPLQIYLGKLNWVIIARSLAICSFWILGLYLIVNKLWRLGLKAYRAEGR